MSRTRNTVTGLAVVIVLALSATVAFATHDLGLTYSVSSTTASAVVTTTASANAGTSIPKNLNIHLDPGAQVAYADDAVSPVTPPPINGDRVGQVELTGDVSLDGCGNPTTNKLNATWVDPIGSGAPAGSVAELKMSYFTVTKRGFIVKSSGDSFQAAAHHDLVVPDMDVGACSGSTSSVKIVAFGNAKSSSGGKTRRVVQRNPKTAGTKTVFTNFTDTSNVEHSGSATYTVTP